MSGSYAIVILKEKTRRHVLESASSQKDKDSVVRVYEAMEGVLNYVVLLPLFATLVVSFSIGVLFTTFLMVEQLNQFIYIPTLWVTGVDMNDLTVDSAIRINTGVMFILTSFTSTSLATFITAKIHYNKKKKAGMKRCLEFMGNPSGRKAIQLIADKDGMCYGKMARDIISYS